MTKEEKIEKLKEAVINIRAIQISEVSVDEYKALDNLMYPIEDMIFDLEGTNENSPL